MNDKGLLPGNGERDDYCQEFGITNGVASGEDAVKYLLAGASVVQVCTAVIVNGYQVIEKINSGIVDYMRKHHYSSISQFKGLTCDRILSLEELDRRRKVKAIIDPEICTGCGACHNACFYGAIVLDGEQFGTTSECVGCGLCYELCDFGAISIVPLKCD